MKSESSPRSDVATPSRATPQVMQVERHDFVDLVPVNRIRTQPMQGFDDIYTDIVDYIVR